MTTNERKHHARWHGWLALLAVTLFAFALRWYYVSTAVVLNPVRGDATQYYAYALNLANHGIFSKDLPGVAVIHPDNYRDPGYPVFLAIWMKLLGAGEAWYAAVLLGQALLGALTITLATQLGRHWLPLSWATAAGVLMALWPHSVTINGYLLSETLFGFLCALGLLAFASARRRRSPRRAFVAGVVLGAAALTNAVLLPFGILLAVFMAWRKLAGRSVCVALAVGALALPGAWSVRNALIVVPVAGNSSTDRALLNLALGSWPGFQSAWRDSVLGDATAKIRARRMFLTVDAEYMQLRTSPARGAEAIVRRFARHPLQTARWYLIQKPMLLWGWSIEIGQGDIFVYPTKNAPFQTQSAWIALAAICHALNLPLMLLALAGASFVWSKRQYIAGSDMTSSRATSEALVLLVVFITVVYSTLQAEPRYSIPFRPFEILLAISLLSASAAWWQQHRREVDPATPPLP